MRTGLPLAIVAPDGGREETVALDPRSCLPVQQEHDGDESHVTTTWPRWTTVDGVRLPAEAVIKTSRGDEIRIAYTATRINPAIDPALFQPPGVDPRARVPRLTAPVELPAELTQNHVYVQARVNGQGPVALLVDTGAGSLVLDRARATQLGLSGAAPFQYDASGLVLESPDDAFRRAVIKNVLPSSPAADAGLAVDDEVIRIDGDPVSGLTLDAIRARLRRAGQRIRLEIRRGDAVRTTELALRALI